MTQYSTQQVSSFITYAQGRMWIYRGLVRVLWGRRPNNFMPFSFQPRPKSPSIETFLDAPTSPPSPPHSPHTPLGETLSDSAKKRPAPQPPSPRDEGPPLRAARSSENLLELSCRSELRQEASMNSPAPIPRRSLSLSQDCLLNSGVK